MITRLTSGLWGGWRAGSFAGRESSERSLGKITRLTSGLWGGRLVGSFVGRVVVLSTTEPRQFFANFDRSLMESVDKVMKRRRDEEDIVMLLAIAVTKKMLH